MFHVGEKVLCIDAEFCILRAQCPPALVTPVEGQEYTVRAIGMTENGTGVLLVELDNRHVAKGYPEASFAVRRFRRPDLAPALALAIAELEEADTCIAV